MITINQYIGKWSKETTPAIMLCANDLLEKVNALMAYMESQGVEFKVNPHSKSQISGETYGGFRPLSCPQGASKSAHKSGMAVDIYDPENKIDNWLLAHADDVADFDLFFEHPNDTPNWSHWGTRAPKSGNLFFHP